MSSSPASANVAQGRDSLRWDLLVLGGITALWAVVHFSLKTGEIAGHWRQAETQSMALNLVDNGFNVFMPQINWGGDGPGYVEAEFPLYQALTGVLLAVFGDVPWPGQLISLLCMGGSAWVLRRLIEPLWGRPAALVGAVFMLAAPLSSHLGVSVMPDAACGLLYTIALERFVAFTRDNETRTLVWSSVALIAASLIKPIALHLGAAEFGLLLLGHRQLLRTPRVWVAWAAVLLVVAGYLAHAANLFHVYGNGFGIVSGADSKFPGLEHIASKENLYLLTRTSLRWGVGVVALGVGVVTLVLRRWTPLEYSLAVANVMCLFVSLRYSASEWMGRHYHLFAMYFGALLVAHGTQVLITRFPKLQERCKLVALICCVLCLPLGVRSIGLQREIDQDAENVAIVALGNTLRQIIQPGELVVMQSDEDSWDSQWQRTDNYQDPRGFYASHTKGWVMPRDRTRVEDLADMRKRGARYYVVAGSEVAKELAPWLEQNAALTHSDDSGFIYRLHPAGG